LAATLESPASPGDARGHPGDDRPVPETRWICLFVSAILIAAVVLLWFAPGRTDDLWAWPIKPPMTPLFMGSAYAAGAFFFARGFGTIRWHRIAAGFPGIAVFATLMFVATLIHWEKFNHGHGPAAATASFYGWTIVYAIAPLLVGGAWLRNRRADPGTPERRDTVVPGPLRALVAVGGAAAVAIGAVLFVVPDVGVDHWPWTLTPLTARVIACFVEGGLIALFLAWDARWSAWRILTQTTVIGAAFLLVSTVRAWDDWERGALTWVLLATLAATLLGAIALHVALDRRARAGG
jgi:peptidoglycan/LPS O-acetylase OafA/YrhL